MPLSVDGSEVIPIGDAATAPRANLCKKGVNLANAVYGEGMNNVLRRNLVVLEAIRVPVSLRSALRCCYRVFEDLVWIDWDRCRCGSHSRPDCMDCCCNKGFASTAPRRPWGCPLASSEIDRARDRTEKDPRSAKAVAAANQHKSDLAMTMEHKNGTLAFGMRRRHVDHMRLKKLNNEQIMNADYCFIWKRSKKKGKMSRWKFNGRII